MNVSLFFLVCVGGNPAALMYYSWFCAPEIAPGRSGGLHRIQGDRIQVHPGLAAMCKANKIIS